MYKVLAYYKYVRIENPEEFRDKHRKICVQNNLLGRIYVANEGLNGTVSGLASECDNYVNELRKDNRFIDIDIKEHTASEHAFQKLTVKVKTEIVYSGLPEINPAEEEHDRIDVKELWNHVDNNTVFLDVRSNYEHRLGKFKNSITLDIDNFRDFPEKLEEIKDDLVGKKVIAICTGDVKCEKASVYLKKNLGIKDVRHLKGGIIRYGMETDGRDFEGKCYVFDNRVAVEINKFNPTILSKCNSCETPTAKMVNCANTECNFHTTICEECLKKNEGACSAKCKESHKKREYNEKGYYYRKLNGYKYN